MGSAKSALCIETVGCVLGSDCMERGINGCYCGREIPAQCQSSGTADGACRAGLERSLETTDPKELLLRISDQAYGGGWATSVVRCLADNRCSSCFGPQVQDGSA